MPKLTPQWIARVTGGEVLAKGGPANGAEVDTRRLEPGMLFVALPGSRSDGHRFLDRAVKSGAAGLLVSSTATYTLPPGPFAVAVADPHRALIALGWAWRRRFTLPVAAITGSYGKSTVKELTAHLLGGTKAGVVAPRASFNNDIGLPLTLLRINEGSRCAVVELGTNAPGEIAALASMAAPQIGVITGVGPVHLEGLRDEAGVAAEKAALAAALPEEGVLILDRDGAWFDYLASAAPCSVTAVSVRGEKAADLRATAVRSDDAGIRLQVFERTVQSLLVGEHNATNLLLALAAARALGVDPLAALDRLADFVPVRGRLQVLALPRGARVIDDSYNSNYPAAVAALRVLAEQSCRGRRIAVFGRMMELGDQDEHYHLALGRAIAQSPIDRLLLVGGEAVTPVVVGASEGGMEPDRVVRLETVQQAGVWLDTELRSDDLVLLKASRGVGMEAVLERLQGGGES